MSNLDTRYPALWHLMGAYLHQDYDQTGTIDENIISFATGTRDLALSLPMEVERALAEFTTEDELDAFVGALGCQVMPPDGLTHREWLNHIAEVVRDGINRRET